jgi:hypothetical protein
VDNGEVIAIDIPYGVYAAQQAYYREAFIAAMADVRDQLIFSVYVTNFQQSSVGTTLIYFDTIILGSDYDVAAASAAVQALFDTSSADCASTAPIGCPAHSQLLGAFVAYGLPAAAAYYNDQFAPSAFVAPNSAINASQVGTWQFADSNEVIAINIAYSVYATQQQYYKEAFTAAVAQSLGVEGHAVFVNDFQQSSAGTTKIYFDVELPATSSSVAVPAMLSSVQGLFQACHGDGSAPIGCSAGTTSPLVIALQQFGLPITDAFYNDEYPSAPSGHRKMLR